VTDRRMPRSSIRPEEAEWLDATRVLLALATGRPMGAYNTVPEAARGVLSYVQRQCAELDAARAEIEQLRAVADVARDIVREGGRADHMSILEDRLRALD
jgi:hypothetical protein